MVLSDCVIELLVAILAVCDIVIGNPCGQPVFRLVNLVPTATRAVIGKRMVLEAIFLVLFILKFKS